MVTKTKQFLDEQTKAIIKATVPVLEEHGTKITKKFYELMFNNHPELKNIFNQTNQRKGDQPKALANTVYAAALHIDQLESILPVVTQIGHKHKSLNIKPEHYPIVGKHLLLAMKEVLGDAATDEIIDAWAKAYDVIADVFITVEKQMYDETLQTTGGWVDFRDFKVVKKVIECDHITSFYLEPVDDEPFPLFQPGQYITVKIDIEDEPYTHLRQYSLSCAPGEGYYRISVKREEGNDEETPAGIVSNHMHNHIHEGSVVPISAPAGDFILNQEDDRPLILISGGVGITPMMSMLESTLTKQPNREIIFIHATKSGNRYPMRDRIIQLKTDFPTLMTYAIYSDPQTHDDGYFDKAGHINNDWLASVIPSVDVPVYFCGPKSFMKTVYHSLKDLNIEDKNIHYEFFGPADELA